MKTALAATIAVALASFVWAGCGSADDSSTGTTGQDLSASAAGKAPGPTAPEPGPVAAPGSGTSPVAVGTNHASATAVPAASVVGLHCPKGEKICRLDGVPGMTPGPGPDHCVDVCVPEGAMCVAPHCGPICDPDGTAPRPGCEWSTTACAWECPVCDPTIAPDPTCKWDPTACVWLCL